MAPCARGPAWADCGGADGGGRLQRPELVLCDFSARCTWERGGSAPNNHLDRSLNCCQGAKNEQRCRFCCKTQVAACFRVNATLRGYGMWLESTHNHGSSVVSQDQCHFDDKTRPMSLVNLLFNLFYRWGRGFSFSSSAKLRLKG